ncbi:hypothetical protein Q5H92_07715 [Hymenobacter sp. M29]|uniref:Uncharacterized protein n=1 Tax=Hymenobacter mellowenesis TaxID=3063995 RepID=A0ABT9A8R5_9BACT|nr:hypothetical protein [Hymenobacter sp. M29]MDO7846237.1 hypothetical protein [Hymenobacter sp. M29]
MRLANQLYFFLTPNELVSVIQSFESNYTVSYYEAGMFPSPDNPMIPSLLEVKSLGYLTIGDWNHSPDYLLAAPSDEIIVRKITLRKGGYSYSVDQYENPAMAVFKPSGLLTPGILIAGSLQIGTRSSYSGLLFQGLTKIIKKHTRRIGTFYVGSDAEEKLKLGWRLVTSASSPKEYDLALED